MHHESALCTLRSLESCKPPWGEALKSSSWMHSVDYLRLLDGRTQGMALHPPFATTSTHSCGEVPCRCVCQTLSRRRLQNISTTAQSWPTAIAYSAGSYVADIVCHSRSFIYCVPPCQSSNQCHGLSAKCTVQRTSFCRFPDALSLDALASVSSSARPG